MKVSFSEDASDDLSELGIWIAERAGRATAEVYLARLRASCLKLSDFPRHGTPRNDIEWGLRTITFERRILIVYRVEKERVLILRLIRTARDIAAQFANDQG
ncbi:MULTISPECIES: type II toxin-antitoxin system RelE/ParE family toxin [Sphingomonas]|uniref:type II toxin-antitoxin system RelE/ParE family toxin n=1 Tax=Sphingomonas TaxID=13687 RepID=UPI0012ED15D5|nr:MULTISPECIES: type II toxin-antitoxin system RelE/ParE family toxin [Sphingomonas]MBA2918196.1 type II toxin-antitoxin system RelE/ParE family toxin [Sphingomonas sp. CGMCC 1.13658]